MPTSNSVGNCVNYFQIDKQTIFLAVIPNDLRSMKKSILYCLLIAIIFTKHLLYKESITMSFEIVNGLCIAKKQQWQLILLMRSNVDAFLFNGDG